MQDILINQLNGMRKILSRNVGSIKSLKDTTNELGNFIDKLSSEDNSAPIKQLNKTKNNINETISDLLHQTEDLFDKYKKMTGSI